MKKIWFAALLLIVTLMFFSFGLAEEYNTNNDTISPSTYTATTKPIEPDFRSENWG